MPSVPLLIRISEIGIAKMRVANTKCVISKPNTNVNLNQLLDIHEIRDYQTKHRLQKATAHKKTIEETLTIKTEQQTG